MKDDTISRAAALEAMDTWDKFGCAPDGKLVRYDDDKHYVPYVHYEDMVHVIKTLPSAQQWIPCGERLPEDYTDVLVWFEYYRYGDYNCLYQMYGIGDYMAKYDSWMINYETGWRELRVLAWWPLPEPYKEDADD